MYNQKALKGVNDNIETLTELYSILRDLDIESHYYFIFMDKSYLAIIPGLFIMTLVLSFINLGNGLRDLLDVKN